MGRRNFYLSAEIEKRLAEYRNREWGSHHSLSGIVERAIREYLDCLTTGKPVKNYITLTIEEYKEFNDLRQTGMLEELMGLPLLK